MIFRNICMLRMSSRPKLLGSSQGREISIPFYRGLSNRLIYSFKDGKQDSGNSKKQSKEDQTSQRPGYQKSRLDRELQQSAQQQLTQLREGNQNYKIISRSYNETQVPGLDERKYADLNEMQQEIIKTNKFDLLNPQIMPKTGSTSSYVGITDQLTQISLGKVKIKGKHEVFLSEIDPENIPADLDIKFDSKKELKVVGKETNEQKQQTEEDSGEEHEKKGQLQLKIQAQTIQQKTFNQHMENEFGMSVKGYQYSNIKNWRRWDIFLSLVLFAFFLPIQSTFRELKECYNSTKAIEDERMKQITQLKQRSFQRVLLENKDFNTHL